jgi:D-alanyl-D-alanine carboxypeptidase/D-alanyl-D-alanine-endopeptidase (penicillin-binding protein 4)
MLPASNMKIITAVAVLATLGEDARFTTRVRAGGAPGEVVLQGGGDPLLTTSDLQKLATRTARQVTGPVVVRVDDDLFPVTGKGPGWTDGYLPYVAAPVEALARLGDYSPDPSTNAARVFVQQLRAAGLKARLGEPTDVDDAAPVLAQVHSSVEAAVSLMLSRSENNVAEVLFRQVAVAEGIEPTWRGARAATENVLRRLGLDPTGMRILDGSGLSRRDGLSPRFLADVLRLARITRPEPFTSMFEPEAMPVSGQTGTLDTAYGRYVTRNARCAQGAVMAKTGSLFDTITLSGVARVVTGGERVFSILVNDRPQQYSALSVRQVLDGLTATITGCWD